MYNSEMKPGGSFVTTRDIAVSQREYMQKVYAWMLGGLLLTGFSSMAVVSTGLFDFLLSNSYIMIGLVVVQFLIVGSLAARIEKMSTIAANLCYLGYSILTGVTLSSIFLRYSDTAIQNTFLITAGMFGAMSLYGYLTKKDLSGVGSFMFMGLIGIIIASVVNIFAGSGALDFLISTAGVIVFTGLTAWDTQKIKEMHYLQYEDGAMASKSAIMGALTLYLDFINLFLMLLRLFGGSSDRD